MRDYSTLIKKAEDRMAEEKANIVKWKALAKGEELKRQNRIKFEIGRIITSTLGYDVNTETLEAICLAYTEGGSFAAGKSVPGQQDNMNRHLAKSLFDMFSDAGELHYEEDDNDDDDDWDDDDDEYVVDLSND